MQGGVTCVVHGVDVQAHIDGHPDRLKQAAFVLDPVRCQPRFRSSAGAGGRHQRRRAARHDDPLVRAPVGEQAHEPGFRELRGQPERCRTDDIVLQHIVRTVSASWAASRHHRVGVRASRQ